MPAGDATNEPAHGRVKLTYDDFMLFPDDGKRHELIDGAHYVTPSPNTRHQTIAVTLTGLVWTYLQQHPAGRLFPAPFDVVFSNFDVVEPDLLFIANSRLGDVLTPKHVRGAPDLVVEIGSESTRRRDEREKRTLYERAGVSEYWFIDPDLNVVRVYRRDGEGFAQPVELTRAVGNVLSSPLLPGLELPLDDIFSE